MVVKVSVQVAARVVALLVDDFRGASETGIGGNGIGIIVLNGDAVPHGFRLFGHKARKVSEPRGAQVVERAEIGIVPVYRGEFGFSRCKPVFFFAGRTMADVRPEGHVVEHSLEIREIFRHFLDLRKDERAVFFIVRTAQTVAAVPVTPGLAVGIHDLPIGMTVSLDCVVDQTVIPDGMHPVFQAEIDQTAHSVSAGTGERAVCVPDLRREIAVSDMGLQIQHRCFDAAEFQILRIGFGRKFR